MKTFCLVTLASLLALAATSAGAGQCAPYEILAHFCRIIGARIPPSEQKKTPSVTRPRHPAALARLLSLPLPPRGPERPADPCAAPKTGPLSPPMRLIGSRNAPGPTSRTTAPRLRRLRFASAAARLPLPRRRSVARPHHG